MSKNRKLKVVKLTDLTGWFQSTQRPAKQGPWETKSADGTAGQFYSYWSGEAWGYPATTPEGAVNNWNELGADTNQTRTWRGVVGN